MSSLPPQERPSKSWSCRRHTTTVFGDSGGLSGALRHLGHQVSHQTVANILKGHGIEPAPERGKCLRWRDFLRSHLAVLAAVDFFTAEVWTAAGLVPYYVLTCLRVASRQVCIAGITT